MHNRARQNINKLIKRAFALAGYEIKRMKPGPPDADRLLDDPREAFIVPNHKFPYAFRAVLANVRDHQGFSFGSDGWHPFVWALRNSGGDRLALRTALHKYYSAFRPLNAKEAIIGFDSSPKIFNQLPPYMFYLTPWSNLSAERARAAVEKWVQSDNRERGIDLTLSEGGFPAFGPVSDLKLELQAERLCEVEKSLRTFGYDRSKGACKFRVIKLGRDIRLIPGGGGYHRTVGAAALSWESIPGQLFPGRIISDIDDVEFWPNVKSGLWKRSEAIKYVEYLFSFDASSWAQEYGLN